jgi:hypothetical protein
MKWQTGDLNGSASRAHSSTPSFTCRPLLVLNLSTASHSMEGNVKGVAAFERLPARVVHGGHHPSFDGGRWRPVAMRRGAGGFAKSTSHCLQSNSDPECPEAVECAAAWRPFHNTSTNPPTIHRTNPPRKHLDIEAYRWHGSRMRWRRLPLIDEFMRLCALHNSFGPSRYNR